MRNLLLATNDNYDFLQSLRANSVGGDLLNYAPHFEEYGQLSWGTLLSLKHRYEIGYTILSKLVYIISGGNFHVLLAVIALFYHVSLTKFIIKYSGNCLVSAFLYVALSLFNVSMNNLRSTIALSILYLGLPLLFENRYVKFAMVLIVAGLFHNSIFSLLPFFISTFIKNKLLFVLFCAAICLFIGLAFDILTSVILGLWPKYVGYFAELSNGGGMRLLLFLLLLSTMIIVLSKRSLWKYSSNCILLKMLICGVCLQLISMKVSFFARAVSYSYISLIVLLPEMTINCRVKRISIISLPCIISCFWFFYILSLIKNFTETVPYKFMF